MDEARTLYIDAGCR